MYLLAIHIPIIVIGRKKFVDASWYKDLILVRDWLAKEYEPLVLLAPALQIDDDVAKNMKLIQVGVNDGIRVITSFNAQCRTRHFWGGPRKQWLADVHRELVRADIIHCSTGEILRPTWYLAQCLGVRSRAATVLVGPDMDPHLTLASTIKNRILLAIFDHMFKKCVKESDLVLLKEGEVHRRYVNYNKNTHAFCHTMYHESDLIDSAKLEGRLESLNTSRPIRAVYAGRFVERKGLLHAITAIGLARRKGVDVEYHLFGNGPEEVMLRQHAIDFGVGDLVKFHGYVEFGSNFLNRLSEFDLLLFTPTEEDTPRMLYDAMAVGLPLLGSRIPFLEYRVHADHIGVLADIGNSQQMAFFLCQLQHDRSKLCDFSKDARVAGEKHSVENWYRRRAEWTREAFYRKRGSVCSAR